MNAPIRIYEPDDNKHGFYYPMLKAVAILLGLSLILLWLLPDSRYAPSEAPASSGASVSSVTSN